MYRLKFVMLNYNLIVFVSFIIFNFIPLVTIIAFYFGTLYYFLSSPYSRIARARVRRHDRGVREEGQLL